MMNETELLGVTQVCSARSGTGAHTSLSSHESSGQAAFRYSHLRTNKSPGEVTWLEWLRQLADEAKDPPCRVRIGFGASATSSKVVVY